MSNSLSKNVKYTLVQPASYSVIVPGYSYIIQPDTQIANLNVWTYINSYLTTNNYSASDGFSYPNVPMQHDETGWYVNIYTNPRIVGNIFSGYLPEPGTNLRIDIPVLYTSEYTLGTVKNIPTTTVLVIPPAELKETYDQGWNASANSVGSFVGAGEVSFSINELSVGVFVGLSLSEDVTGTYYNKIKYVIYATNTKYEVYVDNVSVSIATSFSSSDVFKIVVEDLLITFYVNDIEIYSEVKDNTDDVYYLDSSLYYSNDEIINATITQNAHIYVSEIVIEGILNITGSITSPNIVKIEGTIPISCKIIPYYGIFGSLVITGKLFSKNVISIHGSVNITGLIEPNLIKPKIPISIYGKIVISGSIRMPLRGKPIMFINT